MTLHVRPRSLQYWSVSRGAWQTAHGPRGVLVGGSSRDLPLQAAANVP